MTTSLFNDTQPVCILVDCRKITLATAEAFKRFTLSENKSSKVYSLCLHGVIPEDKVREGQCCSEDGNKTSVQLAVCKLAALARSEDIGRVHILADHEFRIRDTRRHEFNDLAWNNGMTVWTNKDLVEQMKRKGARIMGSFEVGLLEDFAKPISTSASPNTSVPVTEAKTWFQWACSYIWRN